jgi:hypothetical protein
MLVSEERVAPPRPRRTLSKRLLWLAGLIVVGVGLWVLYYRQSLLAPFNSDAGANTLQAWAMLHGNPLLRDWWTSDVSFYTTELPEYAIIEAIRGLSPDAEHIAGALTYTLTVLLAALVARGKETGLAGLSRALLAGGILLAPGIVLGTPVFLENPDHAGTAVPILLLLLVLDRCPQRWYTAAAACVLLAWTDVADQLTLVAAAAPLAVVAVVRLGLLALRRRPRAEYRYDALLTVAAIVSVPLGSGAEKVLRHLGGFQLRPLPQQLLAPRSQIRGNVHVLGQALMVLFGTNVPGRHSVLLHDIAYFHWIGLGLAVLGFAVAAVTFFTRWQDRVTQVVVVAALAVMAAAVFGTELPDLSHAHEIAVLAPFGAVLAGRALPPLLFGERPEGGERNEAATRRYARVLLPLLSIWVACGLAALCWAATWSPLTPANQTLATWLVSHGYTEGLAGYWQASATTVVSGDKVVVAPIQPSTRAVMPWETFADWYNPATHRADFIIAAPNSDGLKVSTERKLFGAPAREYHVGQYVVMTYNYNLLTRLSGRSFPGSASELANDS